MVVNIEIYMIFYVSVLDATNVAVMIFYVAVLDATNVAVIMLRMSQI